MGKTFAIAPKEVRREPELPRLSAINERDEFNRENSDSKLLMGSRGSPRSSPRSSPRGLDKSVKRAASELNTPAGDEQAQILSERLREQDIELREKEARIAQLNEEKYQMAARIKELGECCEDLKRERDVTIESLQRAVLQRNSRDDKSESFLQRNAEDSAAGKGLHSGERPIKLSKFRNPSPFDPENFSVSSYSKVEPGIQLSSG